MSKSGVHECGSHIIGVLDRESYNETSVPAISDHRFLPTAKPMRTGNHHVKEEKKEHQVLDPEHFHSSGCSALT